MTFPHSERLTITLSAVVAERLKVLSFEQGRSTSNLAAYLIERALEPVPNAGGYGSQH